MLTRATDVKTLMTGIRLGESPRWHDGRLWFCDWIAQTLYAVAEDGTREVIATIDSLPFCIDWLADGRLLVVNAKTNTLMRREPDGRFVTHADLSPLSPYGCNEIAVAPNGNIYLNNINFVFPGGEFRPGFIALRKPDGTLLKVEKDLAFPNGMVVTPDGRTLIVAESYNANVTAFDIAPDGTLTNKRLWAHLEGQGGDGISLDSEGAVWVAAGPHCVRVADGGEVLDEVQTDRMCFSCALGGSDGKTLFITANKWPDAIESSEATGALFAAKVRVPA
jgi:sugar lactone lactonase YvrE